MSRNQESLIDIAEAIKLIFQYVEGTDLKTLAANIEKQDAILRRITIIGEATKRLSQDFRNQHPSVPWKKIAGMRDVITHEYNEVDLDEVWTVINENLPQLLKYIEPLVLSENDETRGDCDQTEGYSLNVASPESDVRAFVRLF